MNLFIVFVKSFFEVRKTPFQQLRNVVSFWLDKNIHQYVSYQSERREPFYQNCHKSLMLKVFLNFFYKKEDGYEREKRNFGIFSDFGTGRIFRIRRKHGTGKGYRTQLQ